MKLPNIRLSSLFSAFLGIAVAGVIVAGFFYNLEQIKAVQSNVDNLSKIQKTFEDSYVESLYEDHLKLSEQASLKAQVADLEGQLTTLAAIKTNQDYLKITKIYDTYKLFTTKLNRNISANLDTKTFNTSVSDWGQKLLNKTYDTLQTDIDSANKTLDESYNKYLASLPKPSETTGGGGGGSYITVDTEKGKFGVYLIKAPLSSVRVITASANSDNCKNNCPTKTLAEHVKDNGGFAGMNGAYFCPPDYASCSGKTNSSDYAFYKTSSGKWLNKNALSWGDTGLATFNGRNAKFYKHSSDYDGDSVTAGLSNYPTLLSNGEIAIDNGILSSYQKDTKGLRGAIGVGKSNLYLAIITNATVIDAAYVMRSLGAQDALNLDGGGSSALYLNGGYIVGPGRSLPNAIVLVK